MTDPFLALALLERDGKPLIPGLRVPCQSCDGTGKVYSLRRGHGAVEIEHALCQGRGWVPLCGPAGEWALLAWAVVHDLEIEFRPDRRAGPHICMFNWNWG